MDDRELRSLGFQPVKTAMSPTERLKVYSQSITEGEHLSAGQVAACMDDAAEHIEKLTEALYQIAHLRPAGECRNKLVEQMERIALGALERRP